MKIFEALKSVVSEYINEVQRVSEFQPCGVCRPGAEVNPGLWGKDLVPNMNKFCDWLFETKVISVLHDFFLN